MTPDQQFIIAILTLVVPIVGTTITIIGGLVMFREQNKKLEAATTASKAAEAAANHGKEAALAMQRNFDSAVAAIAPREMQKVEVVNTDPVAVVVVDAPPDKDKE